MMGKERSVATDADDGEEGGREGKAQEKRRPFQTEGEDRQATEERKQGGAQGRQMGQGLSGLSQRRSVTGRTTQSTRFKTRAWVQQWNCTILLPSAWRRLKSVAGDSHGRDRSRFR
jgi:hypothetical protein